MWVGRCGWVGVDGWMKVLVDMDVGDKDGKMWAWMGGCGWVDLCVDGWMWVRACLWISINLFLSLFLLLLLVPSLL